MLQLEAPIRWLPSTLLASQKQETRLAVSFVERFFSQGAPNILSLDAANRRFSALASVKFSCTAERNEYFFWGNKETLIQRRPPPRRIPIQYSLQTLSVLTPISAEEVGLPER